jgi:putative aldouronate transport system permease protein
VYRKGLIDADYSFSTAVNLFNSVVNIIFLTLGNKLSKKFGQGGIY